MNVQPESSRLLDFPALARWYGRRKNAAKPPEESAEVLICGVCLSLSMAGRKSVLAWTSTLENFVTLSSKPLDDYLSAEAFLQDHSFNLTEYFGDIAHAAIAADLGQSFLVSMKMISDALPLTAFRFLSAWTALNIGDLKTCVDECEKVTEPFASIHTLHGQALLELGEAQEAVEILKIALSLAPQEILAQFQLAKAYLVIGKIPESWNALIACSHLAPLNPEVALMMTMVAMASSENRGWLHQAWEGLYAHLPDQKANPDVVNNLFEIALRLNDETLALKVAQIADLKALARNKEFIGHLGGLLRKFGNAGWSAVSQKFLAGLTEHAAVQP